MLEVNEMIIIVCYKKYIYTEYGSRNYIGQVNLHDLHHWQNNAL